MRRILLATVCVFPIAAHAQVQANLTPATAPGAAGWNALFAQALALNRLGAPNGVASLDATTNVPAAQLGNLASTLPGMVGIASGGSLDTVGNSVSGGTPSAAPTAHTLNLSCLPNGFPGGAPNVRNHAQVCIQGIASKYGNNGIFGPNGQVQTGPNAYNDNDYMVQLGFDVQPGSNNPVGLFDFVQGEAGAPQLWAVNTVTNLLPGFTNSGFGYELDLNNQTGNGSNSNRGFWATGASNAPNFAAYVATGVAQTAPLQWHFGYAALGSIDTADFVSQSTAADSLNIQGTHGGSGLKLAGGNFGPAGAISMATDPTNGVPQSIHWSDQNGGNYGTWKIEVDKTSEADLATALAFDLPLGTVTLRYDGSVFIATAAPTGGGNLTVAGNGTFGGGIGASGVISTAKDLQTTGGNVDLAPSKALVLGLGGSKVFYLTGDGNGNAAISGPLGTAAFTVANLPTGCTAGQVAYATDGRKSGEAAGAGSGTPVICTPLAKGSSTSWVPLSLGTAAVAN